jgi:hypothetical protein
MPEGVKLGVGKVVLRISEILCIEIALFHKCAYAVINLAKADTTDLGQYALDLSGVFLNFSSEWIDKTYFIKIGFFLTKATAQHDNNKSYF